VQKYTVFSAGIVTSSEQPGEAAALLRFFASPEARPALVASGLEPMQ